MQITRKQYNNLSAKDRSLYRTYRALTVRLPYAHYIAKGWKTIEIRKQKTYVRNRVVICSSQAPQVEDMQHGATLCTVEIYDCIPVHQLTEEQWKLTYLPEGEQEAYKDHYAWMLRDAKQTIELPVKGQLNFWNLILPEGALIEYPVFLPEYERQFAMKHNNNKKYRSLLIRSWITLFTILIILWLIIYSAIN